MKKTGCIRVGRIGAHAYECVAKGYLRVPAVSAAQERIEALFAENDGPLDSLFDGTAIEGFELGLPMVWVRWSLPRLHRFGKTAIVGRPGPMLDAARPIQLILPTLPMALFATRDEARAFLER